MLDKHTKWVNDAIAIPSDMVVEIKPTNRTGESRFGSCKNLLKANSNKSAYLLEAELKLMCFSPEQIFIAMDKYSPLCLYSLAENLRRMLPTRPKFDNKQRQQLDAERVDSSEWDAETIGKRFMDVMVRIELVLPEDTPITRDLLQKFISDHVSGTDTTETATKSVLYHIIQPYFRNWINEKCDQLWDLK